MDVRCVQYHGPCCFSLRSWWCYSWSHRTGRSLPIRLRTSAYSFRCPFRLRELQACEQSPDTPSSPMGIDTCSQELIRRLHGRLRRTGIHWQAKLG